MRRQAGSHLIVSIGLPAWQPFREVSPTSPSRMRSPHSVTCSNPRQVGAPYFIFVVSLWIENSFLSLFTHFSSSHVDHCPHPTVTPSLFPGPHFCFHLCKTSCLLGTSFYRADILALLSPHLQSGGPESRTFNKTVREKLGTGTYPPHQDSRPNE